MIEDYNLLVPAVIDKWTQLGFHATFHDVNADAHFQAEDYWYA